MRDIIGGGILKFSIGISTLVLICIILAFFDIDIGGLDVMDHIGFSTLWVFAGCIINGISSIIVRDRDNNIFRLSWLLLPIIFLATVIYAAAMGA